MDPTVLHGLDRNRRFGGTHHAVRLLGRISSPRADNAYCCSVQSRWSRHCWKAASLTVGGIWRHAASKPARACSKSIASSYRPGERQFARKSAKVRPRPALPPRFLMAAGGVSKIPTAAGGFALPIRLNTEFWLPKPFGTVHNTVMYFTFTPLLGVTIAMLCVFALAADESS
jgi:hypothetical protein